MNFLIIFLVIVAFITISVLNTIRKDKSILVRLRNLWGGVPKNQYNYNDFTSIRSYYENKKNGNPEGFYIDDITWNDLDMDKVFLRINSTQTTIGEEYLYSMLREVVFDPKLLDERNELIEYFKQNPVGREKIQLLLAKLGKKEFLNISDYFYCIQKRALRNSIIYKIVSITFIVSPFITAANPYGVVL